MRTGRFYEINVSKNGRHIFATDSSIREYDESEILGILNLFNEKFSKSDGYEIVMTVWHCGSPPMPEEITTFVEENWKKTTKKVNGVL